MSHGEKKNLQNNICKMYCLLLLLIGLEAFSTAKQYNGYQVYRITPTSAKQVEKLAEMQLFQGYDFWRSATVINQPVDILVSPKEKSDFFTTVTDYKMKAVKNIDNVQTLIDNSYPKGRAETFDWNSYYHLQTIYNWLDTLPFLYPGKVSIISAGKSYQNRDLKGVKVSFGSGKKAIFLEGGIHAREWISPATVTYMLAQILGNKTEVVRNAVEQYDWYVFPVTNPDGYEYTFFNRMWRKSRQPSLRSLLGWLCKGTDLNRNWDYHWGENGGGSFFACSESYFGKFAFSAVETKNLADFISTIQGNLTAYLSYHSYGQYILLPYGDTSVPQDQNGKEMMEIANKAAQSLARRYGTNYTVGNNIQLLKYVVTGDSMDWVKYVYKIPLSLTYELRDNGQYGFLLPPEHIIPCGQETFESLLTIVQETITREY